LSKRPSQHDIDIRFQHGANWSACSARGLGRAKNSDALAVSDEGPCLAFVVADGAGSLALSPLASETAAAAAAEWVRGRQSVGEGDIHSLTTSVNAAVYAALQSAALEGAAAGTPASASHDVAAESQGATTIACAMIDGDRGIIATVGDSEALAVGDDGPAHRLNELDHVPARPNMLLAWIDGTSTFEPHVIPLDPLPRRLCLVTDGIVKVLDYDRIAALVRESAPAEAARVLVLNARKHGASDDVTALVLSHDVAPAVA
jgi:serine/threonine protein phosphatase PrpC